MRILWLKSDLLLPLDKGGRLRTWHLMRRLAQRHDITYLAFGDRAQFDADGRLDASLARGMQEVATSVHAIERTDPPKGSWRFKAEAAMHLVDRLPYAVAKYRSRAFQHRLQELLAARTFDLIVCDFLFPAVNLPARLPCPAVIFTHNVESEIWRRYAETEDRPLKRRLYEAQHKRMLRYEERTMRRFDGVLAVSDADATTFRRLYPETESQPIHVVPTGVDTDYFAPSESDPASRHIVFTGSMDWLPNEDAMVYFCREILPLIRAEEPDVRLSIVGRAPTPQVWLLANEQGVEITGRVDDVRPYMRDASVYVVPLRIGGGTRLKIFEAMSMGKAVVSTTVGAEGLPVTSGEHLLLADEPNTFARSVVRLMRDVDRRRQIEAAARTLVVDRYDWSAVAGSLEGALQVIADRGTRSAAEAAAASPSALPAPHSALEARSR